MNQTGEPQSSNQPGNDQKHFDHTEQIRRRGGEEDGDERECV